MIVREWRGRAEAKHADAYAEHFEDKVARELRGIDGFLGADLIRRSPDETTIEYTVLSRWESMEAIREFAGDDPSQEVVEPGAVAALSDFDSTVAHHQLIVHVPSESDPTQ